MTAFEFRWRIVGSELLWSRMQSCLLPGHKRRAGVSPARVGEADELLALTRLLGRRDARDACPTLPASPVRGVNVRSPFSRD
jgi:hypothetical protein